MVAVRDYDAGMYTAVVRMVPSCNCRLKERKINKETNTVVLASMATAEYFIPSKYCVSY
jgi:hypothetical protein